MVVTNKRKLRAIESALDRARGRRDRTWTMRRISSEPALSVACQRG